MEENQEEGLGEVTTNQVLRMNYEADIAYLEGIDIAILSSVNLWCRISTIFKQKVIDKPQSFGSFYDANGEKYCAISALAKYLGYDIAAVLSNKIQNSGKITNPEELIPYAILEKIESFAACGNSKKDLKCFCSRPNYYYRYSLISLLMHLNDYHKMTFSQIGHWLESKDM